MRCSEFRLRHLAWLDGDLPGSEALRQRAHADACRACGAYDEAVRSGLLQARNHAPLTVSRGFRAALAARLALEGAAEAAILPAYGREQLQVAPDGPRDRGLRPGVRLPRCG
jgi:hypothetical protein